NSGKAEWPNQPCERPTPPWPASSASPILAAVHAKGERRMSAIICERGGYLAHLRLNRPDQGNRFSMAMFRELGKLFTELDADAGIRCILLTANGADFSLGVDIPDVLPAWAAGKSPFEDGEINPFGTTGPRRCKPFVTVVQGQCFNAGLELVLAADIAIAAD